MFSLLGGLLAPFAGPATIVGIALALLSGVYLAGDLHGRKLANANCEARVQQAIVALHNKENLAAKTARDEENKEAAADKASEDKSEKNNEALAGQVGTGPCLVGHDADLVRGDWGVPIPHPKPDRLGSVTKRLKKVLH